MSAANGTSTPGQIPKQTNGQATMMPMTPHPAASAPPTGQQFEIVAGEQRAVVTEVGAGLRCYRVGERDVVMPYDESEMAPAAHGALLLPWPNRIRDGQYTFGGVDHELWLSEPERQNAIHGLIRYARFAAAAHEADRVVLRHDLVPQPGYPYALAIEAEYALQADGLALTVTATNTGAADAPYGFGFHPWLSPGAHRIDDCTLDLPGAAWIRADERLLPVEEVRPLPADKDFSRPRRVGQTVLDDAYVDVPTGISRATLTDPDGVTVSAWGEDVGSWQACTGDDMPVGLARSGLATEPMTCTADAFRTGDRLIVLTPGSSHTMRAGLALTRP